MFLTSPQYNFCEPANASIIKATINIHKELKQSARENRFNFWLTTAMTVLVIILTLVNLYIDIKDNTSQKIDELNDNLYSILTNQSNILNILNEKFESFSFDLLTNNTSSNSSLTFN